MAADMTWVVVASVGVLCFALRVSAPLILRGRTLPEPIAGRLNAAVPPILAALVAVQLFVLRGGLTVDARAGGVAVGGATFVWRRSFALSLGSAAAVAAVIRWRAAS